MSPLAEIRPATSQEQENAQWRSRHIGRKKSRMSPFEEAAFKVAEIIGREETASLTFTGEEVRREAHSNLQGIRRALDTLGISINSTYETYEPNKVVLLIRKNYPKE